jgi:NADP-dependent 3-hydroxy acid dehydrogenase YdfG
MALHWAQIRYADVSTAVRPDCWLIVGQGNGVADAMRGQLEARGESVAVVRFPVPAGVGEIDRAATELRATLDLHRPSQGTCAIVYLGAVDLPISPQRAALTINAIAWCCCLAVNEVVGAASSWQRTNAVVWVVTRGAQHVITNDSVGPAAAATWGFCRALSVESADHWGGLIDLDPHGHADVSAAHLTRLCGFRASGRQIAVRDAAALAPSLIALESDLEPVPTRICTTWVVTGGLGMLGGPIVRWLSSTGARDILLLVRPPLDALHARRLTRAQQVASRFRARVYAIEADVSDEVALADNFAKWSAGGGPPVHGVLHLASNVALSPASDLDAQSVLTTLMPKAAGAIALNRVLTGSVITNWVTFSSASAILPSPLLSAYAAANAFVDAFAYAQRADGVPAQSIGWGMWERDDEPDGSISRSDLVHRPITQELGMRALSCCIASGRPYQAVLDVDWLALKYRYEAYGATSAISLFAEALR